MRAIGPFLQILLLVVFVTCYALVVIPAAVIFALCKPQIAPARRPRVKTTIGHGPNIRRIY